MRPKGWDATKIIAERIGEVTSFTTLEMLIEAGGYKANNSSLRGDKMKFKPTGKNGIDTSGERWRLAPDCSIGKCPACKLGRCIRIGDCLIKKD